MSESFSSPQDNYCYGEFQGDKFLQKIDGYSQTGMYIQSVNPQSLR